MIEKVAEAMAAENWEGASFYDLAKVAIEAMREPNIEMIKAGENNIGGGEDVHYIFMAMIDAALAEAHHAND